MAEYRRNKEVETLIESVFAVCNYINQQAASFVIGQQLSEASPFANIKKICEELEGLSGSAIVEGQDFSNPVELDISWVSPITEHLLQTGSKRHIKVSDEPLRIDDGEYDDVVRSGPVVLPMPICEHFLFQRDDVLSYEDAHHMIQTWIKSKYDLTYRESNYYVGQICAVLDRLNGHDEISKTPADQSSRIFSFAYLKRIAAIPEAPAGLVEAVLTFLITEGILRFSFVRDERGKVVTKFRLVRRPEYNYVVTRLFGATSFVPGLSQIFKGAILPRTKSGRPILVTGNAGSGKTSLAIQSMAGMARRGGIATYFSFEESRELIQNRLVAFNLVDNDAYHIEQADESTLEEVIRKHHRDFPNKGLFILFGGENNQSLPFLTTLQMLSELAKELQWYWRGIVIDSLNAILIDEADRNLLEKFFDFLETSGFYSLILSETEGPVEKLSYLADTCIRLNRASNRLGSIEIDKCRVQSFYSGQHRVRISEGIGMKIYPSMMAVQESIRNKPLYQQIKGSMITASKLKEKFNERSVIVLHGGKGEDRTLMANEIALDGMDGSASVLVLTFATPPYRYRGRISADPELRKKLDHLNQDRKLAKYLVRWISPGTQLHGEQILMELSKICRDARRTGFPVERVVIDEMEMVKTNLPNLDDSGIFWPTLIHQLATEAPGITSVLSMSEESVKQSDFVSLFADYVVDLELDNKPRSRWLS